MFSHCTPGWSLNRPSTLAARVRQGIHGREYGILAPVTLLHNHRARARLQHCYASSEPAQESSTEPVPLSWPEAPAAEAFFGRQHELECLTGLLSSQPHSITILTGPISSGKTALVQHYMQQLGAKRVAKPIYIDCREVDVQTPDYLAETLLRIASGPTRTLPAFAGAFLTAVATRLSECVEYGETKRIMNFKLSTVIPAFSALPGTSAVSRVLELFQQGLHESTKQKASARTKQWPAIIIDEANALTSWSSTHPRELNTLLRCFVKITKQENAAHVVLVTSDYAFIDWLAQGVKRIYCRTQVIGDFRTEEARQYYDMLKGRACDKDEWRQVHEVCGGNPGLLRSAALDSSHMLLSEALRDIKSTVSASVNRGMKPQPEDGWTLAQYATAVRSILAAPANAVSAAALETEFGGGGAGAMVLHAMSNADLLAYRLRSSWAQDIPSSAFGKGVIVVTAPTPADLACMRELKLPEPAPSARTATTAGASSEADGLEGFLAKLGLSEHLQLLQSSGYDLDILKRGSRRGAAYVITPNMLREDSQQSIPIGHCAKIMMHAAKLLE